MSAFLVLLSAFLFIDQHLQQQVHPAEILSYELSETGLGLSTNLDLVFKIADPPRQKGMTDFSIHLTSSQFNIPDSLSCEERILTQQLASAPNFKDVGCVRESSGNYKFQTSMYSEKLMHLRIRGLVNPSATTQPTLSISLKINYLYDYYILLDNSVLNFNLSSLKANSISLSYVSNKRGSLNIQLQSLTPISSNFILSFARGYPETSVTNKVTLNGQDSTDQFTFTKNGDTLQISPSSTIPSGNTIGLVLSDQYFGIISPDNFEASLCIAASCTSLIWQNYQADLQIQNAAISAKTNYFFSLHSFSLSDKQLHLIFQNGVDISQAQCSPFPCHRVSNSTLMFSNPASSLNQYQITVTNTKNPDSLLLLAITMKIFKGSGLILEKQFSPFVMASIIDRYFCATDCDSCVGSSQECTTCRIPSQAPFYLDFKCLSECPSRHISAPHACEKCNQNCQKCSISESNTKYCLQCQSGFYLSYGQCVPICQSSITSASICLASSASHCQASNCENCEYGSSTRCGKCKSGFQRFHDGQCIAGCPTGFYKDEIQGACLPCASNCDDCISLHNCLECSPLFLLRQSVSGECVGRTSAITIFESPTSELPHLISSIVGFSEQISFLQDLSSFALQHSFYKYSEINQLHRILELLLPMLPNNSQSLDQFASTFYTVLSRVQVVHLDMRSKIESLFSASLSELHSFSLSTPQPSFFSLLNGLAQYDSIVTLPLANQSTNTLLHTGSYIALIQPESMSQISLTAYGLDSTPSSKLKIHNQGQEAISTLSRLVVLKQTSLLFENSQTDKLMTGYALSLRSSNPTQTQTEYTFTVKNNPSDFQLKQLRYLASCQTTSSGDQFKCTCSGDFTLLLIGVSFTAISPAQLKNLLTHNQSTYAGIYITPEMKIEGIVNTLELESITQQDRQLFLEHLIFQIQEVSDKREVASSLERVLDNTLQRNVVSDNELFWVVKAINEYSSQYTPASSSAALLKKFKSLAQIVPEDGIGTGSLQVTVVPLDGESNQLDKVAVTVPTSLSNSYPQAGRLVATLFKQQNLFQNTLQSSRYQIFSAPIQLQLLDSLNREIKVEAQHEYPLVIEFELQSSPSSFQRKCVWWNGEEGSALSAEGCISTLSKNNQRLRCECTHLTYFLAALDTQELIPLGQSLFDLNLHFQGFCVSGGLLLFGFLLAIIAQCLDQKDKEQAEMMGDQRRKWTSPLIWFFPCLLYKKESTQIRKKAKGKQEADYHSPKHRSSPSRDKKPSLFSFESQQTSEEEARQHLHPYSARTSSFCGILSYGFLASNALISPFYAFDPYSSRAGRTSILFLKLLLSLALSLIIMHVFGTELIVLCCSLLGMSLLYTPFSFYGSCFLKTQRKGRAQKYQSENNLQDILPSVQDNRPRDPGFANAFDDEHQQSIRKSRTTLPYQIKCTMLTLLSICLGLLTIIALGIIALLFNREGVDLKLWVMMNAAAIIGGLLLGFFKTIFAAAILHKKSETCCWKCCKLLWVVSHVERVSLNMKRGN